METTTLKIEGMSCGHCVTRVTAAISAVPGTEVLGVEVGTAAVRFDPTLTTAATVAAAVTEAGYPAVDVGTPKPSLQVVSCRSGGGCCCGTK
jgi:copper chaperone